MGNLIHLPTPRSTCVNRSDKLKACYEDLLSNQINKSMSELLTSCHLLLRLAEQILEHIDTAEQSIDKVTDPRVQELLHEHVGAARDQLRCSIHALSDIAGD